jgi:hypothetical protein
MIKSRRLIVFSTDLCHFNSGTSLLGLCSSRAYPPATGTRCSLGGKGGQWHTAITNSGGCECSSNFIVCRVGKQSTSIPGPTNKSWQLARIQSELPQTPRYQFGKLPHAFSTIDCLFSFQGFVAYIRWDHDAWKTQTTIEQQESNCCISSGTPIVGAQSVLNRRSHDGRSSEHTCENKGQTATENVQHT